MRASPGVKVSDEAPPSHCCTDVLVIEGGEDHFIVDVTIRGDDHWDILCYLDILLVLDPTLDRDLEICKHLPVRGRESLEVDLLCLDKGPSDNVIVLELSDPLL